MAATKGGRRGDASSREGSDDGRRSLKAIHGIEVQHRVSRMVLDCGFVGRRPISGSVKAVRVLGGGSGGVCGLVGLVFGALGGELKGQWLSEGLRE